MCPRRALKPPNFAFCASFLGKEESMDKNERESLENKKRDLEATLESCIKNIEDGEAKAKAFRDKRNRCKAELAAINRQLKEE